jgi:asparaginyl-tRNA synthetase
MMNIRKLLASAPSLMRPTAIEFKSPNSHGSKLSITGWIRHKRKSKSVSFMHISDGSTLRGLQCVIPAERTDIPSSIPVGSAVTVYGHLVESIGADQPYDLLVDEIKVCGAASEVFSFVLI